MISVVAEARHCVQRLVAVEVLVARHAIVGAQLQVGQPALRSLHEGFVGDAPACRYGGEVAPLVVGAEL